MSSNLATSERGVKRTGRGDRKPRPRGNYWEITYKEDIPPFKSWPLKETADLANEIGKTEVEVSAHPPSRGVNLKKKRFETCDFNHFTLSDSTFDDCTFVDCRFVKSDFNKVKFSGCRFEICHFLNVTFQNCQFLECRFSKISASAEHLHFVSCSLLAGKFVDALVTNLTALPEDTDERYQLFRLRSTRAKIAGRILVALRDEPEPDIQSDANRSFEIAIQRRQIAEAQWTTKARKLVRRNYFFRFVVLPLRVAALGIMRVAGFFTDWGSSPLKSGWFLIGALIVFSAIYWLAFGQTFGGAMLRSLDCTFVFGYGNYPHGPKIKGIDWVMFINAFAGLWWYGLFIPALTRRLFR